MDAPAAVKAQREGERVGQNSTVSPLPAIWTATRLSMTGVIVEIRAQANKSQLGLGAFCCLSLTSLALQCCAEHV